MPDMNSMKSNGNIVNLTDYFAPIPNGDEAITLSAGGIGSLTPPSGSTTAIITNPVACLVRFGSVPSATNGTYFAAYQGIKLESSEEIAQVQLYAVDAGTFFAQYYR